MIDMESSSGDVTKSTTHQVCMKVPSKGSAQRKCYDALEGDPCEKRNRWFKLVGCVYVGRPKCDGGWYHVSQVKAGSFLANPFLLSEYTLPESLSRYAAYIHARLEALSAATLIPLFPSKLHRLLDTYYVKGKCHKALSVRHYALHTVGMEFRQRLLALKGEKLGCWCDDASACHAGVLAKIINAMAE